MAVTPTGPLSLALHGMRYMLADSSTWRTACGASTQAQALARIHLFEVKRSSIVRPMAIVIAKNNTETWPSFDSSGNALTSFTLGYQFQVENTSTDQLDIVYTQTNLLGGIVTDMLTAAPDGIKLNILDVQPSPMPFAPDVTELNTEGDIMRFYLFLRVGFSR